MMSPDFHSGFVTLIGRPNVGKSTLMNLFVGQKVAIVSEKPQTTRNRILGIRNSESAQIIFMDTPGIHAPHHKLGERMVKVAKDALESVDLVLLVTEPESTPSRDKNILELLREIKVPVFLVINKVDKTDRKNLLPLINGYSSLFPFREIFPVSALKTEGTEDLLSHIMKFMPAGPRYYPDDQVTDQFERSMAAEIIRETIMRRTEEEVPHSVAVEVIEWKEKENGSIRISANIYVERDGQKGIIIGKRGAMLKQVGTDARRQIETLLNTKIFLELWVKVRKEWRNNDRFLEELGY